MLSLSGCLSPAGTLVLYPSMSEQLGLAKSFRHPLPRSHDSRLWLGAPVLRASAKVVEATKTGARLIAEGKLHMPIAAAIHSLQQKEPIAHAQAGGKVLFECS